MSESQKNSSLKDLDKNLIVEASAGTGKTRAILNRTISLIRNDPGLKMSELAAITFTEKAAAELGWKLRQRLEQEKAEDPVRIQRAISEFDQAQISTIHSFCAHLLRLRPIEAGTSPAFAIMDQTGRELFFSELWQKWLEAKLEAKPGFFARLRKMEIPIEDLKSLAQSLYQSRDLFEAGKNSFTASKAAIAFDRAEQEFRALYTRVRKEAPQIDVLNQALDEINDLLNRFGQTKDRVWLQYSNSRLKNARPWKNPAANEIKKSLLQLFLQARAAPLAQIINELSDFLAAIDSEKRKRELLDFEDLLLKARDLVKESRDARDYFKSRFKYILVDEFQDTDPVQVELIFFLAEDDSKFASDWTKVALKPGKLFLVGDPKQSIYRFRRADLQIYDQAKDILLAQKSGQKDALKTNHRSHPGILNWVNLTFEKIFEPEKGFQPPYQELVPPELKPSEKPRELSAPFEKPVILLELVKDDSLKPGSKGYLVENIRKVEAGAIADFIQAAIKNQLKIWRRDGDNISYRPAAFGDFAVLYPKHKDAARIKEELASRDIPFSTEVSPEFLQRDEIAGLRSILKAISSPLDQLALVGALRSIFIATSDLELFEYAKAGLTWEWLDKNPDPKKFPAIASGFEFLNNLYQNRELKPIAWIIDQMSDRSKIMKLTTLHPQFNQAVLNLERIKAAARAFEQEPGFGLFDFVSWIENLEMAEDPNWPELVAAEANNAVKLMSFHKSKGLEFPVVILANLSSQMPRQTSEVIRNWLKPELAVSIGKFQTLNYDQMAGIEEKHSACQNVRNLYVASTRAKQYLIIPDHRGIEAKDKQYIELLKAGLPLAEEKNHPALQLVERINAAALAGEKKEVIFDLEKIAELDPGDTTIEKEKAAFEKEQIKIWERAREFTPITSPSKEEEPLFETKEPGPERKTALQIGIVVHKVIEFASRQKPEFALELAAMLAKEKKIEEHLPEIQDLLQNFWKSELKKKIDAGESFQELPFLIEDEGKIYRGKIDLILRDKDGLHLIDFKTDRVSPAETDARTKAYEPQLKIYEKSLSNLKSHQLASSSILFLNPNLTKKI